MTEEKAAGLGRGGDGQDASIGKSVSGTRRDPDGQDCPSTVPLLGPLGPLHPQIGARKSLSEPPRLLQPPQSTGPEWVRFPPASVCYLFATISSGLSGSQPVSSSSSFFV